MITRHSPLWRRARDFGRDSLPYDLGSASKLQDAASSPLKCRRYADLETVGTLVPYGQHLRGEGSASAALRGTSKGKDALSIICVVPLFTLFCIIAARLTLEGIVVIFRIGENTTRIADAEEARTARTSAIE